ncbi:MAG: nickel-dependent lactate racemase, partial [Candidatus Bathyarchaeia archaeon]
MVEVWLPYGKTEVVVRVPVENLMGVVEPKDREGVQDPKAEIQRALEHPIGSKALDEIVGDGGGRIAIVVDDGKRPAPSRLMVSSLVEALRRVGVEDEDITVIVGCGTRADSGEGPTLFQEESWEKIRLVNHDPVAQDLVRVGRTSQGTEVHVNKAFAEADIRILTGHIGYHPFAGYSGGSRSVLPGVAGLSTIRRNHALLLDPRARAGNLEENPVHLDMTEAARLVGVDFVLNTVLNTKGEVVRAFAGDLDRVFSEGVELVDEMFRVEVDGLADVAIVSPGGQPLDDDL